MPGLKDLLKKKDKIAQEAHSTPTLTVPEFKFIRTTTESEEVIQPPSYPGDEKRHGKDKKSHEHKRPFSFRHSSSASVTRDSTSADHRDSSDAAGQQLGVRPKEERRLSARLHFGRDRNSRSVSKDNSAYLPEHLPDAPEATPASKSADLKGSQEDNETREGREAQWEKRATMLAMHNLHLDDKDGAAPAPRERSRSPGISTPTNDVNIQEAIRLHEEGDLAQSTNMFGQLADPRGVNNALAQVLYGLALRHGWGVPVEPERAIKYLSLAASNSASIEEQALASGMRNGGAAKGELVLAIFELANCFRNGWGVRKDAVAARQYYETAANLGDTDAMEEAAWCYLEGFGGAKDKVCCRILSFVPHCLPNMPLPAPLRPSCSAAP